MRSLFKTNNRLSSKIAIKSKISSKNLEIILVMLILLIFTIVSCLKRQYVSLSLLQKISGRNTSNRSKSLSAPKYGRTTNVEKTWSHTKSLNLFQIRRTSRRQLEVQNICFLMRKFKKLHPRTNNYEISWTGSRNVDY